MVKYLIKKLLQKSGYQLVSIPNWSRALKTDNKDGYALSRYGANFDYELYRKEQEKGNKAKLNQIWTNKTNLEYIAYWIKEHYGNPKIIVCHGTRNGFEQKIFHDYFKCEVIGTEISETAEQFPMTIQADFHADFPNWADKVDIIYSNSLDHAYDPEKAIKNWSLCLKKGGMIILDKASDSDPHGVSDLDPFGISLPNLLLFLLNTLGEKFGIRALLSAPLQKEGTFYHNFIVVKKEE